MAGSATYPMANPVSGRNPAGMRYSSRALSGTMPIIWWTARPRAVASSVNVALASPRSCWAAAFGWPFLAKFRLMHPRASTGAALAQI